MPLSAQPAASGESDVLAASLDNARHLSSLLRAVHFQDHATCFATANGLRVTVEAAKCIQANAFIQVGLRPSPGPRARPLRAGQPLPGGGGEGGPVALLETSGRPRLRGRGGVQQVHPRKKGGNFAEIAAQLRELTG